MDEYKIISTGKSLLPFIKTPSEFENLNLEITIKPILLKKKQDFKAVFKCYENVTPFSKIAEPSQWQRDIRSE